MAHTRTWKRITQWAGIFALAFAARATVAQDGSSSLEADPGAAESVEQAIQSVREQPAVHKRDEPWNVPTSELELELQPLQLEKLQEVAAEWVNILEAQVRERTRMDIALKHVDSADEQDTLAARSAKQQEIVQAVVTRLETVIEAIEKRGGDAEATRQYVSAATGQQLDLADPAVLWAQTTAWLRSSEGGIKIGLGILEAVAILFAFWLLSRLLGRLVRTAVNRLPDASQLLRNFLVKGVQRVVLLIGVVIAVSALGVNITPLVAAIGAAGLVIGLALQGTLSNFASGILILIYKPFDVGDFVKAGGVSGKVNAMTLVSTSILTPDNQVLIVPNNEIWNNVITNVTGQATRRVDLVFGIGYADDIDEASTIIMKTMSAHDKVLTDPEPIVRVNELGDNSVNFVARPWVKTEDYWDVYWDLMHQVKVKFDEADINIPFPQRDLHVPGTIEVKLAGSPGRGKNDDTPMVETVPQRTVAVNEPGLEDDPNEE